MNLEPDFEIETISTAMASTLATTLTCTLTTTETSTLTSTLPITENSSITGNEYTELMNITSRFDGERILGMPEYTKDITLLSLFSILVLKVFIDLGCFLRRKRHKKHNMHINLNDLSSGSSQSIFNSTKLK